MTPVEMYMRMRDNIPTCKTIECEDTIHVIVQLSMCSKAVGADKVLYALQKAVLDEGMKNVVVDTTGCMGSCCYEPIITIRRATKKPVTYCRVTPDMARVILAEYVLRDNIITPWTLDGRG
jgi:(2Fe-2S) ferredoxin